MGKLKFTLSNILFWLAIAASCLLLENVPFLSTSLKSGLSDTLFFMLFALAMIGFIAYFVIDHVKNHSSMDYLLIGLLVFAFIGSTIALFSFPNLHLTNADSSRVFDYSLNKWESVKQALSTMTFVFALYASLFFFAKNYPSIRKIQVPLFVITIVCYAATIYSLATEYSKIVYNYTEPIENLLLVSFFWNSNMFAAMMVMGLLAAIGLNYFKKNAYSYVSLFVFQGMILIIASLTATVISLSVLLIYFLIEIILTMIKKKKKGFLFLALYLFISVGVVVMFACALNYDLGEFSKFFRKVYTVFLRADYHTLTLRTKNWDNIVHFVGQNPINLIFGYGFRNTNHIVAGLIYVNQGSLVSNWSAHNGYMQTLVSFGIVGLVLYASLIFYYIYCFVRILKKEVRFALLYFLIGLTMLSYATMESIFLFNPNSLGIVVGMAFFLPMICKWKHYRHKELGDEVIKLEKPEMLKPHLITQSLTKIVMALVAVAASLFVFPVFRDKPSFMYLLINIIVTLFLGALTLPFVTSCISIKRSRKAYVTLSTLNILLVAGSFCYLILRYYLNRSILKGDSEWVYVILMCLVLFGEVIIFGVAKRQSFKDYLYTFVGMSKNSFMGLIGVAAVAVGTYFLLDKIDLSNPLFFVIYMPFTLMIYFLFSYFVPFKDQKEFIAHYNSLAIYSLKKDVVNDRLGAIHEKYRD